LAGAGPAETIEKFQAEYYCFYVSDELFPDDLDFGERIRIPLTLPNGVYKRTILQTLPRSAKDAETCGLTANLKRSFMKERFQAETWDEK